MSIFSKELTAEFKKSIKKKKAKKKCKKPHIAKEPF